MPKSRTVIFLDIDGVLQPYTQYRFDYDLEKLREELAQKYNNPEYLEMDRYDLGAVQYDWDKPAIERLRKLCVEQGAECVISSDWRLYSHLSRLKDYFRLHDMDQHVTDETPQVSQRITKHSRASEVESYLYSHPEVTKFVILDDSYSSDFNAVYPDHFVHCPGVFNDECYQKALKILKKRAQKSANPTPSALPPTILATR